jgi:hypothetical protein
MTDETAQTTEQSEPQGADDLDALLGQYDASVGNGIGNGEVAEPDEGLTIEEMNARLERADLYRERQQLDNERDQLIQQREQERYEADLKTAVTEIRGDLNPEFFDDHLVTAWLDAAARENPRLQHVFLNRADNPGAWTVAKNQLAKDFQTKFSKMRSRSDRRPQRGRRGHPRRQRASAAGAAAELLAANQCRIPRSDFAGVRI